MAALCKPAFVTVALTNANTEYNLTIPRGIGILKVQCRTAHEIKIAFDAGIVATANGNYWTVKAGGEWRYPSGHFIDEGCDCTLYLSSPSPNVVAEIEAW